MATFNMVELGRILESWGLTDALLPFLLIFTLIFAVLEKSKILGEEKRNLNTAIALVFALIVVIPHITGKLPAGYDPVLIINSVLPSVSLVVVAIISLMILLGVFGHERVTLGMSLPGWVSLFCVVALILIFGSAAGWWASGFLDWMNSFFSSDALAVVIMILVFGVIIAFITGGGGDRENLGLFKGVKNGLDKIFVGGKH